jgi:hypothetical protein
MTGAFRAHRLVHWEKILSIRVEQLVGNAQHRARLVPEFGPKRRFTTGK